jgi:CO/xanthine dehydrogenase Mo-binding subunit
MADYTVLGKPAARIGSVDILTGKARYTHDLNLPGMLVGKLLYSPYPVARIGAILTQQARELPGVHAVLTGADVPGKNSYCYITDDQPLFALEQVRYQGEILAAVAAETEEAAQAALDLIVVDLQPIPGVFDMMAALEPDGQHVWPDRSNLLNKLVITMGDVEAGFAQADVIIENTYTTQWVEQAPLETEAALALVDTDGTVIVHTATQAPNMDRRQIARALGIPESQVRVITPFIGGAFGAKIEATVQIHAALLAQATRSPVKIIRSREESIRTHVKRHPFRLEYRTGATRSGKLTAVSVKVYADTGPYANLGPDVVSVAVVNAAGPYFVPHARLEGYTVLTNNPICGAMRGFGGPQAAFAYESQMDLLAAALHIDPVELRRINALQTGMVTPTGARIRQGNGMQATLDEAARRSQWGQHSQEERCPAPHLRRGWGIASHVFTLAYGRRIPDNAGVVVEMAGDGSVSLRTGAADLGQGLHTALAQLTAEALGVELDAVRVIGPDTDKTLDSGASNASRSTIVSGNAAVQAARTVRDTLLQTAAEETNLPQKILSLRGGRLYAESEALSLTISGLASKARFRNRSLNAIGYYAVEYPEPLPPGAFEHAPNIYTFGAQAAQVLVDIETGQVCVEKLAAVHEAGQVVNPLGAEGQISGGAAMGIGYALMEELLVAQGKTITTSLDTFLIPTSQDVPSVEVSLLEFPEPFTPYGVKGIGEAGVLPTAPAIASAIRDAVGVRLTELPMTPEKVFMALHAQETLNQVNNQNKETSDEFNL